MIEGCIDFVDELIEIEVRDRNIGVVVLCTTKYHAEMVGKGVEYSLGVAKFYFRKIRIIKR